MHRHGKRRFERIGDCAVQLPEKITEIVLFCTAMIVFPTSVADDHPMLDTPGKAKNHRPASVPDTHIALMAISEMKDMRHDVFFPKRTKASRRTRLVPREQWHETLELERVNGVASCPIQQDRRTAHEVRILHFLFWNRSRT